MKAFVLAAGAGTRLRPLTSDMPKPMVPILGKPGLYHTLENLKKYGFTDVCVNLYHQPDYITQYFKDKDMGINLTYSIEKKLLGTAGAVKKKESFFNETFVVMSGDGLTDIDLKKVLEFHKKKRAQVTIVLKKVDTKLEYGVTLTDKSGKVKKFVEKPKWSDIFADTINTGIYIFEPEILEHIPKNKFFDFSIDLFPLLLKKNKRIYGYVMDEYWTDIGNILEYKKGVFDALEGKVKIGMPCCKKGNSYISKNAIIDKSVKIKGPCYIGDNVFIDKNVTINSYSVISKNVKIEEDAVVEKTIIWENSHIGKRSKLNNTIVGYKGKIPAGIVLFDSIIMS
jgi:Nucleoside-diphosphate-sugar pyrophosphorylase involved in lipopolysaccharide biosynthesis/translation initiation factor 2B, gamma/epsilon subunits (eIF-2Bgamma/eIF-2Bepsilon)